MNNNIKIQENNSVLYRKTRRGDANHQRKGCLKKHRNHKPCFNGKIPRGIASKVVACIKNHDWKKNIDLIALRKKGYTPYSRIFDKSFQPHPMRITTRSESREALSALSLVLAANCDYSSYSQYMFEIMLPVEEIARRMGVLHIYQNGRKAYDIMLNALRVLEQLNYIVIHRDHDSDSGQYKPMRIFLTEMFFTSRGMTLENVREWLSKYRQWAISIGISETLRKKYEIHQLKMARLGINIDRYFSLKNRLKKIKRLVVSPDLYQEKQRIISDVNVALVQHKQRRKEALKNHPDSDKHRYQHAWCSWTASDACIPIMRLKMEIALKKEFPHLQYTDPEKYYRLLLEKAGIF